MPKTYSEDFRLQVLRCHKVGKSRQEICEFFSIGAATLGRWITQYNKEGSVCPKARGFYKVRKVDKDALLKAIGRRPDATLKELAEEFGCCFQAIDKWLKKLGITRKKNHPLRGTR